MVNIVISYGELLDKLSILKVKKKQISNKTKLKDVNKEYKLLKAAFNFSKTASLCSSV